jgi:hypothetical protein
VSLFGARRHPRTAFLQDELGQKLVAHMAGVSDPKTVCRWAKGERMPRADSEHRLRESYHRARMVRRAEPPTR